MSIGVVYHFTISIIRIIIYTLFIWRKNYNELKFSANSVAST